MVTCGVLGVLSYQSPGGALSGGITVVIDLLWAGSVLLLAIGLAPEDSVVRRARGGVAAMTVLALWPLVSQVTSTALPAPTGFEDDAWMIFGYFSLVVPTAAALLSAVAIGRAAVVPRPWQWAPAWVLGAQALAWTVPQLLATADPTGLQQWAGALSMIGTLVYLAATLGLGALAIALGAAAIHEPELGDGAPVEHLLGPTIVATPVDERTGSWEAHDPRFRVYFFDTGTEKVDWVNPPGSWATNVEDVDGGEYADVLEYARANVPAGGLFAIALLRHDPVLGLGLVWLSGMDYNDQPDNDWDDLRRHRMEARSDTPPPTPSGARLPASPDPRPTRSLRTRPKSDPRNRRPTVDARSARYSR